MTDTRAWLYLSYLSRSRNGENRLSLIEAEGIIGNEILVAKMKYLLLWTSHQWEHTAKFPASSDFIELIDGLNFRY